MTSLEKKRDAVAKSMGDYLLKGYKMLRTSCDTCNTILLEDRQGNIICIDCCSASNEEIQTSPSQTSAIANYSPTPKNREAEPPPTPTAIAVAKSTEAVEIQLMMEITSATQYLENLPPGTDLQHKQIYIRHIRECAETLHAVRRLKE